MLQIGLEVLVSLTHTDNMMLGCADSERVGLMQVTQSRCYQAAISYWRRIKTEPDARTMGVLYWQVWAIRKPTRFYAMPKSVVLSCGEPCIGSACRGI